MESESAKPALNRADAAGRTTPEDASHKPDQQETIASSSSSFRGLIGETDRSLPGSSFGKAAPASAESDQAAYVGRTFGRYQIRKVLGSGSMGSVFLAHDSQLNRDVALKIPRFEHDARAELSQRLYREARAAANLNHPNICQSTM